MPTNKTNNYNLSQWAANDRVLREDFNADNAKIDAALAATAAKADVLTSGKADATALAAEVQARTSAVAALNTKVAKLGNCTIYHTSYVGDGQDSRTLTFPKKPLAVFILGGNCFFRYIAGAAYAISSAPMAYGAGCTVQWEGNSMTWTIPATDSRSFCANTNREKYYVVALMDAGA